ncbi:DUF2840 domain-containing protein [Gluconobacter japonicus]|uniref:DUF2840 domain-containing protein n=1 Tax=Gluconobacter japonicus TaxID=376620 RepID=UPI0024ACAC30|nr:DUF2840 domain-containing protein [Gluconobacter japonicus]MDI6653933.1 DUF2840 domain-containing protein [Gluconobacter japonicus]
MRADDSNLTTVELTFIEKRIEHWIRFGRPVSDRVLDKRHRLLSFIPGSTFGFIRWAANDYGTVVSCLAIVRTVERGAAFQTVPFVWPGGDLLLDVSGWPQVKHVLEVIDQIERFDFDPCAVSPDHWRHVHNRVTTGQEPRPYTHTLHTAWLKRARLVP